jgi:hypothetical protein
MGWLEFLDFFERNTIVLGRNSDTWEFGKGALSGFRFCGVAVLQCCSVAVGKGENV